MLYIFNYYFENLMPLHDVSRILATNIRQKSAFLPVSKLRTMSFYSRLRAEYHSVPRVSRRRQSVNVVICTGDATRAGLERNVVVIMNMNRRVSAPVGNLMDVISLTSSNFSCRRYALYCKTNITNSVAR